MTDLAQGCQTTPITQSVEWHEGDLPVSTRFKDPYYAASDGRAETEHVFISGNGLVERWPIADHFTIGELGFGTGLNFVETVRHWQLHGRPNARLNYFSFELFPLAREQMSRALGRWPQLSDHAKELTENWHTEDNPLCLHFGGNIRLTVYFGDARACLPIVATSADAWYLDGFSPARNPELWEVGLLRTVYDATVAGGTFATYSAAGWVRRNLQNAGFKVCRMPGFGGKREMLAGRKPR